MTYFYGTRHKAVLLEQGWGGIKIESEALPKKEVDPCHRLLVGPFMEKLLQLSPEKLPAELKTFYEAAERMG